MIINFKEQRELLGPAVMLVIVQQLITRSSYSDIQTSRLLVNGVSPDAFSDQPKTLKAILDLFVDKGFKLLNQTQSSTAAETVLTLTLSKD